MKIPQTIAAALLIFGLAAPLQAQKASQVPEYVGQVNAVTGATTVPLERQNARNDMKVRALGFGGVKTRMLVNGSKSPVRFRQGDPVSFILRVENQERDPLEIIRLLPIKSRKNDRELDGVSTGYAGLTGARDRINERAIPIQAQKLGRNAFKFSPLQPLGKGEYVITNDGGMALNLFAVD